MEKVWNMFKDNNKDRTKSSVSLLLTSNITSTFFIVSIVDFEQVNVCWKIWGTIQSKNTETYLQINVDSSSTNLEISVSKFS